jgi:hypothetical protein
MNEVSNNDSTPEGHPVSFTLLCEKEIINTLLTELGCSKSRVDELQKYTNINQLHTIEKTICT